MLCVPGPRGCVIILVALLSGGFQPAGRAADNASGEQPEQRIILGYVERIWFHDGELSVKAKLDTGAKTSSLDARNIELFEEKGKRWARFEFWTRDKETPFIKMEQRVKRFVRIKRHRTQYQRRAVVELPFCLAGRMQLGEFTLIDRKRFIYPVLLGRQVLKKRALVDAGATFLGGYNCATEPENRT